MDGDERLWGYVALPGRCCCPGAGWGYSMRRPALALNLFGRVILLVIIGLWLMFTGFGFGNFFAEPSPQVKLRQIGRAWHWGKVLFEQWWLTPYGPKREALRLALTLGSRGLGIPADI